MTTEPLCSKCRKILHWRVLVIVATLILHFIEHTPTM